LEQRGAKELLQPHLCLGKKGKKEGITRAERENQRKKEEGNGGQITRDSFMRDKTTKNRGEKRKRDLKLMGLKTMKAKRGVGECSGQFFLRKAGFGKREGGSSRSVWGGGEE